MQTQIPFLRCAGVTFGAKVTKTWAVAAKPSARMGRHVCEANVRDSPTLRALKNNRRILRRAEAPLVCSLFSLPPLPFIRHWRRSAPSPQRCTSVECYVCYKSRNSPLAHYIHSPKNSVVISVKIFQPAKALEIFLLSADYAIYIRGKAPNPGNFAKAALPSLRNWGAVRWAAFSRKV